MFSKHKLKELSKFLILNSPYSKTDSNTWPAKVWQEDCQ